VLALLALAGLLVGERAARASTGSPGERAARASTGSPAARPNVVVMMTDDQTAASLKYMQQANALLAAHGTTFESSIATFPLCCPSRATHLTGQYAHNHGVLHNSGPFGGFARLEHANTLPVWLANAGYRTMHVGRYLNGYEYADGIPPGWSDWHAAPHSAAFNYSRWKVNENGSLTSYPEAARPDEYLTDYQGRRASELIEQAAPGERPFYLQLWFVAPHRGSPRDSDDPPAVGTPSPAARDRDSFEATSMPRLPSFDEANMLDKPQVVADRPRLTPDVAAGIEENWRQELESLQAVDDAVARVVGTLERTGELENTLIVFTSDNGFMHGEHRARGEKVLLYEESIRVPLVIRGPGIPRRFRDPRPVANVDVVPTILDATDVSPFRTLDGRSLLALAEDPDVWWGRDLLIENGNGANNVPAYRAIRTSRFVYAQHLSTGEFELYDLRRDPYQLRSVDGGTRYEAVQRDLAARLRLLKSCAGRGCQKAPALRLALRSKGRSVGDGACPGGDLRVRVVGRDAKRVVRADFRLGSRRLAPVLNVPISMRLRRPPLLEGRGYLFRVRAELRDGRVLTMDRRLRGCGRR